MDFTIEVYKGVGPIRFGMLPEEVRQILGSDFISRPRKADIDLIHNPNLVSDLDMPVRDVFRSPEIVIDYDIISGDCEAITLCGQCRPTFRGKQLLHSDSLESLRVWLDLIGGNCQIAYDTIVSPRFGIELFFAVEMSASEYDLIKTLPPREVFIYAKGYREKNSRVI